MNYSKYHYLTAYEEDEEYKKKVMDNIFNVYSQDLLPRDHVNFLENVLHKKFSIEPQIIYMILGLQRFTGRDGLKRFGLMLKCIVLMHLVH